MNCAATQANCWDTGSSGNNSQSEAFVRNLNLDLPILCRRADSVSSLWPIICTPKTPVPLAYLLFAWESCGWIHFGWFRILSLFQNRVRDIDQSFFYAMQPWSKDNPIFITLKDQKNKRASFSAVDSSNTSSAVTRLPEWDLSDLGLYSFWRLAACVAPAALITVATATMLSQLASFALVQTTRWV